MNRKELGAWRKLYVRESATFAQLSFLARAVAAQLLKLVDDEGRIECGAKELAHVVAYRMGATTGDRRVLPKLLGELIEDGYLVRDGSAWCVRNFVTAQSRNSPESDPTPTRDARETNASRAPTERELDASSTRTEREPNAKSELSTRKDASQTLVRTRALSENQKKNRSRTETESEHREVERGSTALTAESPQAPLALEPQAPPPSPSSATDRVFDHWRKAMNKPRATLDLKRRRVIDTALKSHGEPRCIAAIDGCARSAWHMGANDRGQRYDDLTLILRDAEHIERFESELAGGSSTATSGLHGRGSVRGKARMPSHEEFVRSVDESDPETDWLVGKAAS